MTNFDKVIPPGSEGKINASVDISHATGAIQKSIQVETNDPQTPNTTLVIKAAIKSYVTAVPDQLRFQLKKGETQSQEVKLTTAYEKPITLSNPTVDSDMFEVAPK